MKGNYKKRNDQKKMRERERERERDARPWAFETIKDTRFFLPRSEIIVRPEDKFLAASTLE